MQSAHVIASNYVLSLLLLLLLVRTTDGTPATTPGNVEGDSCDVDGDATRALASVSDGRGREESRVELRFGVVGVWLD